MTVNVTIQDSNGDDITTLEFFEDVYEHMKTEAAIIGVSVSEYIIQIIAGHAQSIIDAFTETT